jgi:class 3 adenylate cyclase
VQRYGLSFVERRAVLLFDIAGFSLYTPFEQASQLNSLSYSMNSAYNKLQSVGIDVPFRRTTTGDGYYVWHKDASEQASRDLLYFLLLIIADNAAARAAAQGNTVPRIRAAYHVGAHYELYQAEGINPTVFSYIVGDATIELARMLDRAKPEQILIGEFPASDQQDGLGTQDFINQALDGGATLLGIKLAGQEIQKLKFSLSGDGQGHAQRITIEDKHGLQHHAYNLECRLTTAACEQQLGLPMTANT